jgi:hypothetical protein
VGGAAPVSSPTKTLLTIASGGANLKRAFLYDIFISSDAAPVDVAILWKAQRFTAPGNLSAFTPVPLDPADTAADCVAAVGGSTVEPTYTGGAVLWWVALNQRATHRAILDPNGPLVVPAIASNGIGLYAVHSTFTGNVDATVYYFE